MQESLMRSFSRFVIFAITALVIACMCCSFAAGQEPDGKGLAVPSGSDPWWIILQRTIEFPQPNGEPSKYLLVTDEPKEFRPRPDGKAVVIPNGIDVPRLMEEQQMPGLNIPKLELYLLIVSDRDLTEQQRDWLRSIFRSHASNDQFEAKRFLDMVAQEDAKRKTTFGMLQPYLAGGMFGIAFLIIMQICREWFAKQSYRDQGLMK